MKKIAYLIITVLMIVAFVTARNNLQVSLECFAASFFTFLGIVMPYEEGVFDERED